MQSIRVTSYSNLLSRLRKWNQFNQFRWTSTKVTPIKKQSSWCVLSKSFSQKFHKNHRKTPVPESLFLKSCRSEACNFIKKETLAQVFSCEFYENLRTPICTEHYWWLLLPTEMTYAGYISTMSQGFKRGSKWKTNGPTQLFLQLTIPSSN